MSLVSRGDTTLRNGDSSLETVQVQLTISVGSVMNMDACDLEPEGVLENIQNFHKV